MDIIADGEMYLRLAADIDHRIAELKVRFKATGDRKIYYSIQDLKKIRREHLGHSGAFVVPGRTPVARERRDLLKDLHAVSVSGGKDSTALLLLMIERGLPIDVVLYSDTGMEFPEMKEHIQKLDELLFRERGLHITTLRHPCGFSVSCYP